MKCEVYVAYLILLFLLALPEYVIAQNNDSFADWLMPKVLANLDVNEKVRRKFVTYDKIRTIDNLGRNPALRKSTEKFQIYGRGSRSYEKLIWKNGQIQNNQRPKESMLDLHQILSERYVYSAQMPREKTKDGRWYFVIDFKPKAQDKLPWNNLEDEGINRLEGSLWIDIETMDIIRMEGAIPQPFNGRKGIFFTYSVYEFRMNMEQEVFSGVMVPKKGEFIMHFDSWAIPETYEKHTYTYENHHDLRIQPQP